MADGTSSFGKLAVPHLRMAPDAPKFLLLDLVTPNAAVLGVDCVHCPFERHTLTLFTAPQGVAVGARSHAFVMTSPTGAVEVLVTDV